MSGPLQDKLDNARGSGESSCSFSILTKSDFFGLGVLVICYFVGEVTMQKKI